MANLENAPGRIVGVRTASAGPLLFCEAGDLSPVVGDWLLIEKNGAVFPARVVLPDSLIETHLLADGLPKVLGLAGQAELVSAGVPWAVETEVARRFARLSAMQGWPYLLKEVEARADRLIVRFAATAELNEPDFVPLLKELAEIYPGRVELFRLSETAPPFRPLQDDEFAGWVNGLLRELDPARLENALVGETLLDESEIYRPGARPAQQNLSSQAAYPVASYDPVRPEHGPVEDD